MSENPLKKLIIITGSPCVGKTAVAHRLFESYENSAHLDDDWVRRVNPFLMDDPRNKNAYKNWSFVLSTYLISNFEYVIFSSVRMIYESNRKSVLTAIDAKDYKTFGFTLTCSENTLIERHKKRGDSNEVSFEWLREKPHTNDFVINTDNKTVMQIVNEIKNIVSK